MHPPQACPSRATWQQLLEGGLPDLSAGDCTRHLEACRHCQAVVEGLTGGNRTWLDIAAELRQPAPHLPPACRRVMEQAGGHAFDSPRRPVAGGDRSIPEPSRPTMTACIHVERMSHRSSIAVSGESGTSYTLIKLIPSGP